MKVLKILFFSLVLSFGIHAYAMNTLEKYSYKIAGKFNHYLSDYLPEEVKEFIRNHPHIASSAIVGASLALAYHSYFALPHLYKTMPVLYKVNTFLDSNIDSAEIQKMYEYYDYDLSYSDFEDEELYKEAHEISIPELTLYQEYVKYK